MRSSIASVTVIRCQATACKKRVLSALIALFILFSLTPSFVSTAYATNETYGTWTNYVKAVTPDINNTYIIRSAAELAWVAAQVNGGNTFSGYTVKVADSVTGIDLTEHYWVPIGTVIQMPFRGILDGNNSPITGMKIGNSTNYQKDYNYAGLIGYALDAVIKNVIIVDAAIYADSDYIGCIAGEAQHTDIADCYASGSITSQLNSMAGGVVGYFYNTFNNSHSISDCYSSVDLSGSTNGSAGGLIGYGIFSNISSCSSIGSVSGGYPGGFIGSSMNNSIKNCFATGNITCVKASPGSRISGGLLALSQSDTIKNCYATGDITELVSGDAPYYGGLIGAAYSITATNVYWNSNATQSINTTYGTTCSTLSFGIGVMQAGNETNVDNSVALTSEEMSSDDFVARLNLNSDGTAIWIPDPNANNGYPVLLHAASTESRSKLESMINMAAEYIASGYPEKIQITLQVAKTYAETVLSNLCATPADIATAVNILDAALNLAYLDDLITIANAGNTSGYAVEFRSEIAAAEALLEAASPSAALVNDSINKLYFALNTLPDFTSVISIAQGYSQDDCTAKTWTALQLHLNNALALQSSPYWHIAEVLVSFESLLHDVYCVFLDSRIFWAQSLVDNGENTYSLQAWINLNSALTNALIVQGNPYASTDDVENAFNALKPAVYFADSEYLLQYANNLQASNCSEADWINLQTALTTMSGILIQEDALLSQIEEARRVLVAAYTAIFEDAPLGLTAVAISSPNRQDGQILGTTPLMEYKRSADTDWIGITGNLVTDLAAGTYFVRYSAKTGFGAGEIASVVVPSKVEIPVIVSQPEDVTVNVGEKANLSVAASVSSGTLSYQWYVTSINSNKGGSEISGAVSPSYEPSTENSWFDYYYCVVTNTDNNADGAKTSTVVSDAACVAVNGELSLRFSISTMFESTYGNGHWVIAVDQTITNYTNTDINGSVIVAIYNKAGKLLSVVDSPSYLQSRYSGGCAMSYKVPLDSNHRINEVDAVKVFLVGNDGKPILYRAEYMNR